MTIHFRGALSSVASLTLLVHGAHAQSLAARVAAVKQGTVEMHFASRRGICGDGLHYLSFGGRSRMGEFNGNGDWNAPCLPGPVRVRMQIDDGAIRSVRVYAGPLPTFARVQVTDLGEVPARA